MVVAHRIHPQVLSDLAKRFEVVANLSHEPWSDDHLAETCRTALGLMAFMTEHVDARFLSKCRRLKIVAGCLKGGDNIDREACAAAGVAVRVCEDLLTEPTAELALALLLSLARGLPAGDRHVRAGGFSGWRPKFYGSTLRGTRVGIAGLGAVGRAVGRNLAALGAVPVGTDPSSGSCEVARTSGIEVVAPRDLADLSMLVLCLPLVPGTVGWLDGDRIRMLAPGALVVNVGRGSTVDEAAVSNALSKGRLGGYAADVYAFEDRSRPEAPVAVDPRWMQSDRTLLTPHLGSAVDSVRLAMEVEAAGYLLREL